MLVLVLFKLPLLLFLLSVANPCVLLVWFSYSYNILKTFVTETGVVVLLDVAQVAKCPVQDLSYCFLLSQGVFLH